MDYSLRSPLWGRPADVLRALRLSRFRGLRKQDAEANIRVANGPKGELRMQRVNDEIGEN